MKYANEYLENLGEILEKIRQNEEVLREAAAAILARVRQGGLIFISALVMGICWHLKCSIARVG